MAIPIDGSSTNVNSFYDVNRSENNSLPQQKNQTTIGGHKVEVLSESSPISFQDKASLLGKLFKGRELLGVQEIVASSSSEALVQDIISATRAFLTRESDKIAASRSLAQQISPLARNYQETSQYKFASKDVQESIDSCAQRFEDSLRDLDQAEAESQRLLQSPPSLSDLPGKIDQLSSVHNNVANNATSLLIFLVVLEVPEAVKLFSGLQASNTQSSLNSSSTEQEVSPASSRTASNSPSSGTVNNRGADSREENLKNEEEKSRAEKAGRRLDAEKEGEKEALKKALEERKRAANQTSSLA